MTLPKNTARPKFLAVAVWMSVLVLTRTSFAAPVTYKMFVFGNSGKLGNVNFTNGTVTFTFQGDTANVFPFSVSPQPNDVVTGYKNTIGTASVTIQDNTGATLASGNFKSSAGIFVSVDNSNFSMGFGSSGGDPVYPGGMVFDSFLSTYNLQTSVDTYAQSGGQLFAFLSCIGFPATTTCAAPVALETDAGDFYMNPAPCCETCCAEFTVQVLPTVPFSAMAASFVSGRPNTFSVSGNFTLGSGSNGINPLTDTVTLSLNGTTFNLPPGSFKRSEDGNYSFFGTVNGTNLFMDIEARGSNHYAFRAQGRGTAITGSPVTVILTIGDDSGSATATPRHDD